MEEKTTNTNNTTEVEFMSDEPMTLMVAGYVSEATMNAYTKVRHYEAEDNTECEEYKATRKDLIEWAWTDIVNYYKGKGEDPYTFSEEKAKAAMDEMLHALGRIYRRELEERCEAIIANTNFGNKEDVTYHIPALIRKETIEAVLKENAEKGFKKGERLNPKVTNMLIEDCCHSLLRVGLNPFNFSQEDSSLLLNYFIDLILSDDEDIRARLTLDTTGDAYLDDLLREVTYRRQSES